MSTTRHLINRQRRLAAVSAAAATRTAASARPRTAAPAKPSPAKPPPAEPASLAPASPVPGADAPPAPGLVPDLHLVRAPDPVPDLHPAPDPAPDPQPEAAQTPAEPPGRRRPSRTALLAAVLALLTVLLGGFAAWAAGRASDLRGSADTGNTALTDTARTSELKGTIAQDVDAIFSYDYADTVRTDDAAKRVLTGRAVQQYAALLAQVRAQAPVQKLVLTTTVTDTGVEMIDGDRARVLVFADQRNTSTAAKGGGTAYAAAMFAVDAVRQGGAWRISAVDTFG
jgi:Mce-associated membrane protein